MTTARQNRILSMILAMLLLFAAFQFQNVSAAAVRTPTPPEGAPSNPASLYFLEGENAASFVKGAAIATDRAYSGDGFGVLGPSDGSKITYENIIAPFDGSYQFAFNYIAGPASGWGTDRSINLYVNGELKKTITFPGTGTWDNWQYIISDLELIGGYNQIAIETNGANNGICIDYFYYWSSSLVEVEQIRFQTNPIQVVAGQSVAAVIEALQDGQVVSNLTGGVVYSSSNESVAIIDQASGVISGLRAGSAVITAQYADLTATAEVNVAESSGLEPEYPHPNSLVYQAEDAALSGGARKGTNHTGYTGTGFVGGYDNSGTARTTFTVTVPSAGEYFISLRYSAGDVVGWPKNRTVGLTVNNGAATPVTFEGTDSTWNTWNENIQKVALNAGANTIAYSALTTNDNSDVINLDKLSVWPFSPQPVVDAIAFDQSIYVVSESSTVNTRVFSINSNGVQVGIQDDVIYSSDNEAIATVSAAGEIRGVKAGVVAIKASSAGMNASAQVEVRPNPTVMIDYNDTEGPVNPSRFGYILTPNYDVADSRLTLLGPVLNRETIPVQNFQAIHDLSSQYYQFENSILQRALEAYHRAKSVGAKWYFLLGMNPSWATASGGPMDTTNHSLGHLKTPEQDARFKQYVKDVLQYFKDHGATPDFANLTNEYWTGLEPTYKGAWEAVREVFPDDIPAVGPSGVGYDGIPDFYIPFANNNQITVEGPAWHAYWTADTYAPLSQLQQWRDKIADLQTQYPAANGKYIIWEENNAGSTHPGDWTRSMANVIRTGVDYNIKGTMQQYNSNGISDLLQTNQLSQNRAIRTTQWWVYYMFSQLSGQYVKVSTDFTQDFTAAASVDASEAKIIFAKNAADGAVNLDLRNQPFSGQDVVVDLYKIANSENEGLDYQYSLHHPAAGDDLYVTVNGVAANEAWMAIVKKAQAPPSFFYPKTPDDGEAATATPAFTWAESQGAASYTLTVSRNKDLSEPVVHQAGITAASYSLSTPLMKDANYYWSVTAVNEYGSTPVSNETVYAFIAKDNANVPSQFGPHLPSLNAPSEAVRPFLTWSRAYNATSYRVVVSENRDLSNPVIDAAGITATRSSHFGPNSQVYYQPAEPLKWDTKYYWTVYAVNENGERPMNGPQRYFTTRAESDKPGEFNLLAPANGESDISTRAVFSWEPSKNAFFYKLEVSANEDMSDPVIVRDRMIYYKYTTEQNALLPNTKYYWRVTALTKDLQNVTEAQNGVLSFTTELTPSSPLLYAQHASEDKVALWFHTSEEAASYKIKYGKSPGQYTHTIADVPGSPFEVAELPNGTYYFAVVASNEHGDSPVWNERAVAVTDSDVAGVAVTGVTLDRSEWSLAPGSTAALKATVAPEDAENQNVVWSSSNERVATVDSSGKVTAIAVGTAAITVTTEDGGFTAQASVTVRSNGSNPPPWTGTPVVTDDKQPEMTVSDNGEIKVLAPTDTDGKAIFKLKAADVKKALEQSADGRFRLTIESSKELSELAVDIPATELLSDAHANIVSVVIESGLAGISFAKEVLAGVPTEGNAEDIRFTVVKTARNGLTGGTGVQLKDAAIYDIALEVNGQKLGDLDGGTAAMSLPYQLKPGQQANKVMVYRINGEGLQEIVKDSRYNAGTGRVEWQADRLGQYIVAYADAGFADVVQQWAKEPIEALAAREIVRGVGDGRFNPDGKVTRAEFIMMIMNLFPPAGHEAKADFSDVKEGAWYYEAIATAQQMGIVNGRPDGSFGAADTITRQEMAVMLYRAARAMELKLGGSAGASAFTDQSHISDYAREAVEALHGADLVAGMGNGAFAPKALATRAQAAVIIYRLLLLV